MIKRLQNRIATSRLTLPVTCVYGVLMMLAFGAIEKGWYLQALCLAVSTILMVNLNNSNALIRVFSRMVSCTFLVTMLMSSFLIPSIEGNLTQIAFILMLTFLFNSYQKRHGQGIIFYTFLSLGLVSTAFIQIIFIIPLLWLLMITNLQCSSVKNYSASIIGLLCPYWCWFPYTLWQGEPMMIVDHVTSIATFSPVAEGFFEPHLFTTLLFLVVLGTVSIIHFYRYSYADTMRTRMLYNSLFGIYMFSLILLILQPFHAPYLLRFIIITISPFIAHFFTFTHNKVTNAAFFVCILLALTITVFNQWMP